jgi:hypothetical protein
MHARVFPTIVMMDTRLDDRLIDDRLVLVILHRPEDARYARVLQEEIAATHGEKIGGLAWEAHLVAYGDLTPQSTASAFYLFPTDTLTLIQHAQIATDRGRVSFGYEETSVENGVMASLFVGRNSTPWLNIDTIRQSGLTFKPTLIQISRHYP